MPVAVYCLHTQGIELLVFLLRIVSVTFTFFDFAAIILC